MSKIDTDLLLKIQDIIKQEWDLLPLTYHNTLPDKCSTRIFEIGGDELQGKVDYNMLNGIWRIQADRLIQELKKLNIPQKIKRLNIKTLEDVNMFETNGNGLKMYASQDDYDKIYEWIKTDLENDTPSESESEEETESEDEDVKEITNVKEITTTIRDILESDKPVEITCEIETQTDNPDVNEITNVKEITSQSTQTHFVAHTTKPPLLKNKSSSNSEYNHIKKMKDLRLFDYHYNIIFPCDYDKNDDPQIYNKLKKNKSNLRTQYKRYLEGVPLDKCKDIPKLSMMIYIINNMRSYE